MKKREMEKLANRNDEKRREFFSIFPLFLSTALMLYWKLSKKTAQVWSLSAQYKAFFRPFFFPTSISPPASLHSLSWYNVWHFPFVIPLRRKGSFYFSQYQPPTRHPRPSILKQFFVDLLEHLFCSGWCGFPVILSLPYFLNFISKFHHFLYPCKIISENVGKFRLRLNFLSNLFEKRLMAQQIFIILLLTGTPHPHRLLTFMRLPNPAQNTPFRSDKSNSLHPFSQSKVYF